MLLVSLSFSLLLLQAALTSCLSGLSAAAAGEVEASGLLLFSATMQFKLTADKLIHFYRQQTPSPQIVDSL